MTAVVLLCIQNFLYKNISQQLNHSLFTLNFLLSFSEVLLLTLKKQTTLFQLPGLFDGCQFYFDGSFVYPTPEKSELVALVKAGSGHVVTREPRPHTLADHSATVPYHAAADGPLAHCSLFVVRDNSAGPPTSTSGRICVVAAQWIINSIATFTLLDPFS